MPASPVKGLRRPMVMRTRPARRADGERIHQAILDAATRLASIEGLNGLTIGRLGAELGVGKSGIFGAREATPELVDSTVERIYS